MRAKRKTATIAVACFLIAGVAGVTAAGDSFASAMNAAMEKMHAAMGKASGGDPDRDFASMMIPHHRAALEMAEAELRFGKDERLQRLAQGIIVEQAQEIAVMQAVLDARQDKTPSSDGATGER
ncbi:MAG TPA: DUF305 domain-containing protein [Vicinamibacterales bacterium]